MIYIQFERVSYGFSRPSSLRNDGNEDDDDDDDELLEELLELLEELLLLPLLEMTSVWASITCLDRCSQSDVNKKYEFTVPDTMYPITTAHVCPCRSIFQTSEHSKAMGRVTNLFLK